MNFRNQDLAGARFDDVKLAGAAFDDVNLRGATFNDVNLTNVSIEHANLTGMTINGVLVEELLRGSSAVLYAKDLARAQAFYQAVAGLALRSAADDHVVLARPAFQLVLVRTRAPIHLEEPPQRRTEVPVKLVFPIASLTDARALATLHGGELLPVEREWDFQGERVCDGNDPEGNVIQFRQVRR